MWGKNEMCIVYPVAPFQKLVFIILDLTAHTSCTRCVFPTGLPLPPVLRPFRGNTATPDISDLQEYTCKSFLPSLSLVITSWLTREKTLELALSFSKQGFRQKPWECVWLTLVMISYSWSFGGPEMGEKL